MEATVWWDEFVEITAELLAGAAVDVLAVGVSGMGPCTLLTDSAGAPLRPAILYGVDTRAGAQIDRLNARFSPDVIVGRCRSALTSQAVGPKLAWIADHEPDVFDRARRLLMPSSYLVWQLTGEYVLDHHSASQAVPLYDPRLNEWHSPWWDEIAVTIDPPALAWSGDIAGSVSAAAARRTGLPVGTPVITGTIDAWAEAASVDALGKGDLMLMYGTTMFLVCSVAEPLAAPPLWGTVGLEPASYNLAGGMATSGAITAWLRELLGGEEYGELVAAAARSGPGANGLVMLPYFAGERTPFEDADARGVVAGLTVTHTAGDVYRAALEATAMGVRHNVEAFRTAGATIDRVVAVGGGTQGDLWTQIVSDVTGLTQEVRTHTIGASYGSARLAAAAAGLDTAGWNPVVCEIAPDAALAADYDELYALYRQLYESTADIVHALAARQRRAAESPEREVSHDQLSVS
jgi:xylulokinase